MKEWIRDAAIVFAVLFAVLIGVFFLLREDDEPFPNIPSESFDATFNPDIQQSETTYKDLLLDNYLISLPTEPVTFEFESNGDGTCTLVGYSVNAAPETVEHIDIPAESPSGEKVVNVDIKGLGKGNIPQIMSVEMHELVLATFEQNDISPFDEMKFNQHYTLVDLETELAGIEDEAKREEAKKELIEKYPFAEIMSAYVLVDDTNESDIAALSKTFITNSGYTLEDYINDYNGLIAEAVKHENVTDTILNSIPRPYLGAHGMPTSATVPEGVTRIDSFNILTLQAVTLPDSLVEIGEMAFYGTLLESVDLPSGLKKIGANAFWECYKLKSITIPSGVTELESGVFFNCESLKTVIFSADLTTIEQHAFAGCKELEEIMLFSSNLNINSTAFMDSGSGVKHIYFNGSVSEWEAFYSKPENQGWDDALDYIVYFTDGTLTDDELSNEMN